MSIPSSPFSHGFFPITHTGHLQLEDLFDPQLGKVTSARFVHHSDKDARHSEQSNHLHLSRSDQEQFNLEADFNVRLGGHL